MANTCTVCNKQLSFIENISQRDLKRCKDCNKRLGGIQTHFFQMIEQAFVQNTLTEQSAQALFAQLQQAGLPQDLFDPVAQKLRKARSDVLQRELGALIETHFTADTLSIDVERYVLSKLSGLSTGSAAAAVSKRLGYLRSITEILRGNIPTIQTSIHLDSDEYAHFDMRVTYYKPNKTVKEVAGRLIGTNKKCYFISDSGADNATIDWNNVGQIYEKNEVLEEKTRVNGRVFVQHHTVLVLHLSVTKGSGGGGYAVNDRYFTKILIDTIVRMWKRQLVIYAETKNTGALPEHVKATVFQRDGGRCMQCGYEGPYIEYDHKVPRSKGGPNTVENIQLLCRMCNLKKGSRV